MDRRRHNSGVHSMSRRVRTCTTNRCCTRSVQGQQVSCIVTSKRIDFLHNHIKTNRFDARSDQDNRFHTRQSKPTGYFTHYLINQIKTIGLTDYQIKTNIFHQNNLANTFHTQNEARRFRTRSVQDRQASHTISSRPTQQCSHTTSSRPTCFTRN